MPQNTLDLTEIAGKLARVTLNLWMQKTLCEFCEFVLYGMCGQTSTGGLNYVFQKFISDRLLLFQIRVLHQKQENELVSKNQKYYFRRQEVSN